MAAAGTWSLATAVDLNRAYQDSWLLEGVWVPLALSLAAYIVSAVHLRRPRHVALLAVALAVLLNAVPALKYAYPYAPTSDTADHVHLMRALALTGQVDPGASYQHTPGLHLLVAALTAWTGSSLWLWARLLPPLLGGLLPLGYYLLCARLPLPGGLARCVLALSPFALPLLYALNGTSFTAPLLVGLLALLLVREGGAGRPSRPACAWEVGHTVLLFLLAGAIIFWHPLSSLLYPLVLLAAGTVGQLRPACRRACAASGALVSLGASMSAAVLVYWACRADYVWARLLKNLRLLLEPWRTPALVPSRLGELDLLERARMALLFHARDAALLALAACGVLYLCWALVRRLASGRAARPRPGDAAHRAPARALHTYGLVWLLLGAVVCAVFAYRFGAQGYQRFLLYLVTLSPLPAGYALWRGAAALRGAARLPGHLSGRARKRAERHVRVEGHVRAERRVLAAALTAVAALSCLQLYPYQPAVPSLGTGTGASVPSAGPGAAAPGVAAPAVWMHLVNSEYQRQLLRYADADLPREVQLVIDYAGHRQARLFFGTALQERLRRTEQARAAPAFLLLHWPGAAGPYMEQAEFRSPDALQAWRDRPGVSTVYDNGGAFVLYHPANGADPFRLERDDE